MLSGQERLRAFQKHYWGFYIGDYRLLFTGLLKCLHVCVCTVCEGNAVYAYAQNYSAVVRRRERRVQICATPNAVILTC